jgi:hypothetical protein
MNVRSRITLEISSLYNSVVSENNISKLGCVPAAACWLHAHDNRVVRTITASSL